MVDVNEIISYEAPGALLKSREQLGSNSSAKMYDNLPSSPTKPNDSESYFHGDEEGANSDGKAKCFKIFQNIENCPPPYTVIGREHFRSDKTSIFENLCFEILKW